MSSRNCFVCGLRFSGWGGPSLLPAAVGSRSPRGPWSLFSVSLPGSRHFGRSCLPAADSVAPLVSLVCCSADILGGGPRGATVWNCVWGLLFLGFMKVIEELTFPGEAPDRRFFTTGGHRHLI